VSYDPSQLVTQSYFVFDARPDTILHNHVRVSNNGTVTGSANLYAVDATTGQTGGAVYLSHNAVQHDVGTWITLGMHHVTLAPGQSQIVPFQVAIPSATWSGQHLGGIVAESTTITRSTGSGGIHINIQNLTIDAVQINLPGALIEQLVATGIQPGGNNSHQSLLVGLDNTGNTMLKSHGNMQVTDAHGQVMQRWSLKIDTFLPRTTITYAVYVQNKALGAGNYQAAITLMYGHGHSMSYTTVFTITEQQIKQVFKSPPSPQAPWFGGSFLAGLPLWQVVLGGLFVLSGIFFWGQKLYQFVFVSRRRG
jgi:hypothetical protein